MFFVRSISSGMTDPRLRRKRLQGQKKSVRHRSSGPVGHARRYPMPRGRAAAIGKAEHERLDAIGHVQPHPENGQAGHSQVAEIGVSFPPMPTTERIAETMKLRRMLQAKAAARLNKLSGQTSFPLSCWTSAKPVAIAEAPVSETETPASLRATDSVKPSPPQQTPRPGSAPRRPVGP